MIQIHQYSPSVSLGDGVSNSIFFIQKLLRHQGYHSEIYAVHFPDSLTGLIKPANKYQCNDKQIILYHFAMGHDYADWIENNSDKKILIYHNITPANFFTPDSNNYIYSLKGREMLQHWSEISLFDGAIGVSDYNSQELLDLAYQNVKTIPLLVDIEKIYQQSWDKAIVTQNQDCFTLLFVGRLSENKCQHHLLEILNRLIYMIPGPVELLIIGSTTSPDYKNKLQQLIDDLNLDGYVKIIGKVTNGQLYGYYHSADIFISMSEHEGFGMPLIEAMLFDIPVLAFESGSIANTMGTGGIIFEKKDYEAIAACISLINKNPAFRRQIIASQRENIKRFDNVILSQQLSDFIGIIANSSLEIQTAIQNICSAQHSSRYQIEGPFDSSYSLALLNRQMAYSLLEDHQSLSLLSTEGDGDFDPDPIFLEQHPELKQAWQESSSLTRADIILRNMYPPRSDYLTGRINIMHNYGWEESAFPQEIIARFNQSFDAVTVMSGYVKKVLIDNENYVGQSSYWS